MLMNKVCKEAIGDFSAVKALRIYPTNEQVNRYNQVVLEHFRSKRTEVIKIKGEEKTVDATRKSDYLNTRIGVMFQVL